MFMGRKGYYRYIHSETSRLPEIDFPQYPNARSKTSCIRTRSGINAEHGLAWPDVSLKRWQSKRAIYPPIEIPLLFTCVLSGFCRLTASPTSVGLSARAAGVFLLARAPKTSLIAHAKTSSWTDEYGSDVLVKPDGFIRIHEKEADGGLSEHALFLEVDRSSETQDTLVNRTETYLTYEIRVPAPRTTMPIIGRMAHRTISIVAQELGLT